MNQKKLRLLADREFSMVKQCCRNRFECYSVKKISRKGAKLAKLEFDRPWRALRLGVRYFKLSKFRSKNVVRETGVQREVPKIRRRTHPA